MAPDIPERGIDLLAPIWHFMDLTPQGRCAWYASLNYGTKVYAASAQVLQQVRTGPNRRQAHHPVPIQRLHLSSSSRRCVRRNRYNHDMYVSDANKPFLNSDCSLHSVQRHARGLGRTKHRRPPSWELVRTSDGAQKLAHSQKQQSLIIFRRTVASGCIHDQIA
jgi:hypothetical protein